MNITCLRCLRENALLGDILREIADLSYGTVCQRFGHGDYSFSPITCVSMLCKISSYSFVDLFAGKCMCRSI